MPGLRSGRPRNGCGRSRAGRTPWPRRRSGNGGPPRPRWPGAGCGRSRRRWPVRSPRARTWPWRRSRIAGDRPGGPRGGRAGEQGQGGGAQGGPGPGPGASPATWTGWWTPRTARRSAGPSSGCGWSRSSRGPPRSSAWTQRRWSPSTRRVFLCPFSKRPSRPPPGAAGQGLRSRRPAQTALRRPRWPAGSPSRAGTEYPRTVRQETGCPGTVRTPP